jgi:1-acyl-sn-glycerol-3-phosphate acyltransferase
LAANIRLIVVITVLLPATLAMAVVQIFLIHAFPAKSRRLPLLWHRMALRLIGVRVHVHGKMDDHRPLMLIANHVSWTDIMVLGSVGELCFIAKDEVKSWPGINWLPRLQRTVFVNRDRKRDAGIQADTIAERLVQGDVMVLFAEGTTGNGHRLLPFKSALFAAPQMALQQAGLEKVSVQPVAIAYNTLHGMPLGRYHQPLAAWPGDVGLMPHLLTFLRAGAFDADVAFGEAIAFTAGTKRKDIAARAFGETRVLFARMRRLYHRS